MATILAVPNFSEGRDRTLIERLCAALASPDGVVLLDVHSDPDHNRSVLTCGGPPLALVEGLVRAARLAVAAIDVVSQDRLRGVHPHVGSLDVAPFVFLDEHTKGHAAAAALVAADRLGEELGLPVFLYGALAGGRPRAELRRGGVEGLSRRIADGELVPEFGPPTLHPRGGATLVAARPPLVAFNCLLAPHTPFERAQEAASALREGGRSGLPGVRALALRLPSRGTTILSFNVERPQEVPLARLLEAVGREVEVVGCEIVGLCPEAALVRFPRDLLVDFDPDRQLLERAVGRLAAQAGESPRDEPQTRL